MTNILWSLLQFFVRPCHASVFPLQSPTVSKNTVVIQLFLCLWWRTKPVLAAKSNPSSFLLRVMVVLCDEALFTGQQKCQKGAFWEQLAVICKIQKKKFVCLVLWHWSNLPAQPEVHRIGADHTILHKSKESDLPSLGLWGGNDHNANNLTYLNI